MANEANLIFKCTYSPIVNYAMQQNHVPVIRELIVTNKTDHKLGNVTFQVSALPEFALSCEITVAVLPKDQPVNLGVIDLQLSPVYLAALTERLSGIISISAICESETIHSETLSIDVLAFDEWGGYSNIPEMISAFVIPNHPVISKIISEASLALKKWTGDSSLDAYQSNDPNRVKMQAAAIYATLQAANITYCVPPASFEIQGQRIRLCDTLLTQKLGTCMDLALLYASCLEAIGLSPLIIFVKGHAFLGLWLVDECFSESVQDDISLLTKRLADGINQVCVVEATALTEGKNISFNEAEKAAKAHIDDDDKFICFIDIKRTRASGIRPLPLRVLTSEGWVVKEKEAHGFVVTDAPENIGATDKIVDVANIPLTRLKQWERKLLDLSLRNTLLNFRITSNTIPLLTINLGDFEDALASSKEFQVLEKPNDWENTLRDIRVFEVRNKLDPIRQLLQFEFQQNRLRTPLTGLELGHSITNLYRSARTALEENGANTLYLALGLLKWFESAPSQKARYAPIVLLPVEIVRKSAKRGYVIRSRDEEAQMNITLLEMLRQDFGLSIGGLDPLPKDQQGVDLKRIFNIIRQAVMNMPRWDVIEEAFLGIFSFSQFIMWNDIRNRSEDLARNKIVASLMSGKLEWHPDQLTNPEDELDELYSPEKVCLPVSADSSQLRAITAACEDKSFVLHGPPGTGKSQTITNVIANALAQGKTVLFVAEKMAALSVVLKRLAAIGLGPFCLELHSNKARKKYVLDQLKETTEIVKTQSPDKYLEKGQRLSVLRKELNDYVQALYKKYPFDINLYDAITRYGELSDAKDVQFPPKVFETMSRLKLTKWMDLANELSVAGAEAGHPNNHSLREMNITDYSQSLKTSASTLLKDYANAIRECGELFAKISKSLALTSMISTQQQVKSFSEITRLIRELTGIPSSMLTMDDAENNVTHIKDILTHGELMANLRKQLLQVYHDSILTIDAQAVLTEWQKASMQWFLPKVLGQNRIGKMMRQMALTKNGVLKNDIPNHLNLILEFNNEKKYIEVRLPQVTSHLGLLWQDLQTDWNKVNTITEVVSELERNLIICTTRAKASQIRYKVAEDLTERRINFKELEEFNAAYNQLNSIQSELSRLLGIEMDAFHDKNSEWFSFAAQRTSVWMENLDNLRAWYAWLSVRKKALEAGLSFLVDEYESGRLSNEEVVPAFEKGLYKACAEYIISQDTVLNRFSGKLFEEKIRQFRETNDHFEELTRKEIYARLVAKIPNFVIEASQSSELGILQRAIKSNGRGLSIRKLFEQIPNLLLRLSPCMLMSPISVAQYLDPKNALFDLVVFDEASQMPTSEAVGALARGKNAIIVGDPKQLPPTNFFAVNRVDEENYQTEDLESILDDCLALSMPETHLLWHYRSKHESLIAFSNRQYYENKLLTFPSPNDLVSKVKLYQVNGFYDRGKTKHNKAEAKAVVDEIVYRLKDPVLSKYSIGVVTFSSVQQNLIDDMLLEVFKEEPDLEEKATLCDEPVFIKNLENVQGDERDVILFSVGYGPDENGKLTMNFGPLNQDGGWRRLNVAVSRARHEMSVYSTIRSEQLDIGRTSSLGVAGLKAFLEFAQKGKHAMAVPIKGLKIGTTGISKQIASMLKQNGFNANIDIGSSGYRIDVGVVHPEKPEQYILGIMTDGEVYKSAKTARDRELLQYNVLKQLGWNIYKVWALDWWENPDKEMQKITKTIEALHNDEDLPKSQSERISPISKNEWSKGTEPNVLSEKLAASMTVAKTNPYQKEYKVAQLLFEAMSADEFCLPENTKKITQKISDVISAEAPISKSLLCKRVLHSYGIARMGARLERRFEELFTKLKLIKTRSEENTFFWKQGQTPENIAYYRISLNEAEKRNAEDIPPEETAYAVKYILMTQIGLPREDLIRETAKAFGYQRMGRSVELAMNSGIEITLKRGWAGIDLSGNVVLK